MMLSIKIIGDCNKINKSEFDFIIIGGGIVGLSTAYLINNIALIQLLYKSIDTLTKV